MSRKRIPSKIRWYTIPAMANMAQRQVILTIKVCIYYIYFDVKPGFGYYLPENASVKVIRPRAAATEQSTMRLHTARSIRGRLVRLHTDRRPEIPD